jgi:CcmD family protein
MTMLTSILQQAPAETTRYMVAGYLVIFSVMSLYILSLFIRRRNLERELQILDEMEQNQK